MTNMKTIRNSLEVLEARIAPASAVLPSVKDALWITGTPGDVFKLSAGQGLSTQGALRGNYLLFIEQGDAWVFTTDLNNNDVLDINEITGIAAGPDLRLISFVDIHGDIATNLKVQTINIIDGAGNLTQRKITSLTDSDSNSANDDPDLKGDGLVILGHKVDKIELRPLTLDDVPDQNNDGVVDQTDVNLRQPAYSTFSIYGNIYAGGGFGSETGGLIFDAFGLTASGATTFTPGVDYRPSVAGIYAGSAVSNHFLSFGSTPRNIVDLDGDPSTQPNFVFGDDIAGLIVPFTPSLGQVGADIRNIAPKVVAGVVSPTLFNIGVLQAGDGGIGAKGGDIINVTMSSDDTAGYRVLAGNGGRGPSGGAGGSILNFSDLGSQTARVVFKGGQGGTGTTGAGGSSGISIFGTTNLKGDVNVLLGDGGDGFTAGGNGASLAVGDFTEPTDAVTYGGVATGTSHLPDSSGGYTARIGDHVAIDFDGDGFGDFVYTTKNTSSLMVKLGDGFGGFKDFTDSDGIVSTYINLSGPRNSDAMTVGDVNRDGHPDIIVASSDPGGTGNLMVFLAKFEDLNGDGVLTRTEDLNSNGVNDFIGFWEARHSTLPIFGSNRFGITDIAIGDLNGDGVPELVVSEDFGLDIGGGDRSLAGGRHVILTADREINNATGQLEFTGQFSADFGRPQITTGGIVFPADNFLPVLDPFNLIGSGSARMRVEISAITSTDTYDVIFASLGETDDNIFVFDASVPSPAGPTPIGVYSVGIVDLDRNPGFSPRDFITHKFNILDLTDDGIADLVAVSEFPGAPDGHFFMNDSIGDPANYGSGFTTSGVGNNAGNYYDYGYPFSGGVFDVRGTSLDGDGLVNDILTVSGVALLAGPWAPSQDGIVIATTVAVDVPNIDADANGAFVGVIRPTSSIIEVGTFNYGLGNTEIAVAFPAATPPLAFPVPFAPIPNQLVINAGDGGNSLVGNGGNGGSLGGGASVITQVDPNTQINVVLYDGALSIDNSTSVSLFGGRGGDGFANGGNGGSVTGVDIMSFAFGGRDHIIVGGDGGRGVTGTGGMGGNLSKIYAEWAVLFIAGDGGRGRIGGKGGSVIGNGTVQFPDTDTDFVDVFSGQGGAGSKTGGHAGDIINFSPYIEIKRATSPLYLNYESGAGGAAFGGRGGDGGDIINSSPRLGNQIRSDIRVVSGNGGPGITGGHGGDIATFVNLPRGNDTSAANMPRFVTFIAGAGGAGTSGDGGNGGSITGVNTPSISAGFPVLAPEFGFDRVLAGNGGSSAGANGGNGGTVTDLVISATSSIGGSIVVVGGAGGLGVQKGGKGGNVFNISDLTVADSTDSKVLIVAGKGGDASAFVANPDDATPNQNILSFGGKVGKGGEGGSIEMIINRAALRPHFDFIAGDGGSTINYGTVLDSKSPFVGKGGSIRNLNISSNIGNVDPLVGIKSYNDVLNGESMDDFISAKVRDGSGIPFGTVEQITDGDGNVGIVVGAAGRNKAVMGLPGFEFVYRTQPARFAINGSLEDIQAGNLMSAVAGNVQRIASIQVVKALNVPAGIIGASKDVDFRGIATDVRYLDPTGAPLVGPDGLVTSGEPVREGRLIDGALIAKVILNGQGQPSSPPGLVFLR